jgi:hypothetical protein
LEIDMATAPKLETAHWQDQPAAAALLRSLTPADVHIVARTPVIGPRFNEWAAPEHDDALYELRRAFVAARFGGSFTDCQTDTECRAYLREDARHDSVAEVLRSIFGPAERFGRATERVIDCDRAVGANERFRTEYEGELSELRAVEAGL